MLAMQLQISLRDGAGFEPPMRRAVGVGFCVAGRDAAVDHHVSYVYAIGRELSRHALC